MNEVSQQSDYQKYWLLLRRKFLPASIVAIIIFTLSIVNILRKPDIYQASGLLVYKSHDDTNSLIGLEEISGRASNRDKTIAQEISVLKSAPILKQALESVPPSSLEAISVDTLQKNVSINLDVNTGVIKLQFNSKDPDFAQTVVNRLMNIFLLRNIRENRASTIAAGQFISKQLPVLQGKVLRASEALQQFQETHGLLSLDATLESTSNSLIEGQKQLSLLESQLEGVNRQISDLQDQLGVSSSQESLQAADVNQSPEIKQTINSYRQVRRELNLMKPTLTSNHPQIIDLKNKLRDLSQELRTLGVNPSTIGDKTQGPELGETRQGLNDKLLELMLESQSLEEQRKGLMRQQSSVSSRVAILPELQKQYRELLRELEASELTYETLLNRLQEIRVSENQTIPNVEIIEPAKTPEEPVLPNRASEIIRSAIISLLLGYVTAYLLDRLDRRIRNVDDVRSVYEAPILGTIPIFDDPPSDGQKKVLTMIDRPTSSIAESYRMVQANLKFLQSDHPLRVIAISSATPGEGKSTSSANLAIALAESKRVLLIDADLRRPTQHQLWEAPNAYGLSNLLADVDRPLRDLEKYITAHNENLSIFPAGVVPPNPVTLLESRRLQHLLEWAKDEYEYIVIDLPPINIAADALFVGKESDGLLLVGRPDKLNRTAAKHCFDSLKQAQVNLLGILVNGMIIKNEPNSYYYYKSYYQNEYYKDKVEELSSQEVKQR